MKSLFRLAPVAITAAAALAFTGCSHSLEVRNLRSYTNLNIEPLSSPPLTIGVVPSTPDVDCARLVKGIGTALERHAAAVYLPYAAGDAVKPDVIANISINPEYHGSGWNFLVNFPGFLVWAPAWHGYHYNVAYDVGVSLTDAAERKDLGSWTIPMKLKVRHADMDRTWTEISWFEWGVIALVGGFVFISYDDDVTPLLVEKIENPVGDYIAQDIVGRINASGIANRLAEARANNAPAAHLATD